MWQRRNFKLSRRHSEMINFHLTSQVYRIKDIPMTIVYYMLSHERASTPRTKHGQYIGIWGGGGLVVKELKIYNFLSRMKKNSL